VSVRRVLTRALPAWALVLGALVVLLVVPAGAATAAAASIPSHRVAVGMTGAAANSGPSATPSSAPPIFLARTGLDLTTPIVVGLAILLLGTVLVAWAVLHGSRTSDSAEGSHR
jgi:hypothetical protein